MVSRTITIASGIWLTGFLPYLPGVTASLLVPLTLACVSLSVRCRPLALLLALMSGIGYADYRGAMVTDSLLDPSLDHQVVSLTGEVAGLPQTREINGRWQHRFDLVGAALHCKSVRFEAAQCDRTLKKVRLSWRTPLHEPPRPGQTWAFEVKLRRPRGYANFAGFDYGDWLVQRGYAATGYVRADARLVAEGTPGLRYRLREELQYIAGNAPNFRLMQALAIADRSGLTAADWRRFADTGTSHLLAISGLHIGIAAGVGGLLGATLSRLFALRGVGIGLCTALPALLLAFFYSTLAGWSLPTQRAFVMAAALTLALSSRRQTGALAGFSWALLAVLLVDPLAGFGAGFYLSFGAVAILLVAGRGRRQRDRLQWRAQWAIAIGMLPLLIVAFGLIPLATLPANLLSIPLYSLLIVPLLLGAIGAMPWLPGIASGLVTVVDQLLALQQAYLQWLQALPPMPVQQLPLPLLVGVALASLCFVLPRAVPGRFVAALVLCVGALVNGRVSLEEDELALTILDAGQGLSVVMQQGGATLVYDVGPAYGPDFDTGNAFLLPLLRSRGIRQIDTLVISHGDSDHAGALPRVIESLDPERVWAGELPMPGIPAMRCRAGDQFAVGRAQVEVLYPAPGSNSRGNNASCVLRVSFANTVLLLPGDIEARAERGLLVGDSELAADVVVAPHHGSKTSSSSAFVATVGARHVVFSAGWRHHFGHPHSDVVARWCRHGGRIWSTAAQGAIEILVDGDGQLTIGAARARRIRYWHRSHPFRCV